MVTGALVELCPRGGACGSSSYGWEFSDFPFEISPDFPLI
jgi:hypothetical protein